MDKKDCFIIMPISTPEEYSKLCSGDKDHFTHVLKHLFIPAIEGIGLNPIPPLSKGSELIHAEIIKKIENSEYVLCDMSALNPNVFFELGIRTAINKPVALVKDDVTSTVPFDTHIINNHTYRHKLTPWELDAEIIKLKEHLDSCFLKGESNNSLWKYFSISSTVPPINEQPEHESKIDFLSLQVAALRKELKEKNQNFPNITVKEFAEEMIQEEVYSSLMDFAQQNGINVIKIEVSHKSRNIKFYVDKMPIDELAHKIRNLALRNGYDIQLKVF